MPFLQWLSNANLSECPSCGDSLTRPTHQPPHTERQGSVAVHQEKDTAEERKLRRRRQHLQPDEH